VTANIQISGKANNGIIFVVGGDTYDEFRANLIATLGSAQSADETIVEAARLIIPPSVGQGLSPGIPQQPQQTYQPPPQQQYAQTQPAQYQQQDPYQQANNVIQGQFGGQTSQVPDTRAPAGPPPGGQGPPLCPMHNQPAKWVNAGVSKTTGKPYSGFYTCSVAQRGDRSCKVG
jgi:hypothetical protein